MTTGHTATNVRVTKTRPRADAIGGAYENAHLYDVIRAALLKSSKAFVL
jgi:alkaline phosphatase